MFRRTKGEHGYSSSYSEVGSYTATRHLQYISMFTRKLNDDANILDIGCGYGLFLRDMKKFGFDNIQGVELDPKVAAKAKSISGCDILTSIPNKRYHGISLIDVIEHVEDPVELLSVARDHQSTGDTLFLSTPNIDSLNARLYGQDWVLHSPPQHIVYIGAKSITKLLKRSGYKVAEVMTVGTVLHNQRYNKPTRFSEAIKYLLDRPLCNYVLNEQLRLGSIIAVRAEAL